MFNYDRTQQAVSTTYSQEPTDARNGTLLMADDAYFLSLQEVRASWLRDCPFQEFPMQVE